MRNTSGVACPALICCIIDTSSGHAFSVTSAWPVLTL